MNQDAWDACNYDDLASYDDREYGLGRADGAREARARIAKVMTFARKGATPEATEVLDALAEGMGFKTETEVTYIA